MRKSQRYTAVNKDGFEVAIICREQAGDDPHPIKLSAEDDDFWVAQARRANVLLDSPGFSAVIVGSNGSMARMNTVHPRTFVAFKRWLSNQAEREAMSRRRDVLQADAVQELLEQHLPQHLCMVYGWEVEQVQGGKSQPNRALAHVLPAQVAIKSGSIQDCTRLTPAVDVDCVPRCLARTFNPEQTVAQQLRQIARGRRF